MVYGYDRYAYVYCIPVISSLNAIFSSYSSSSTNISLTPATICSKTEWTQKQTQKVVNVLTTQAFHTSCYDGVGFRGEQNSVGVPCKSSLLFSSFLLLILKLSTERWTLWIESYLLNQLTLIYLYDSWLHLYKEKRGTGQRPNRLNQCQKSILHTLFFPFSRLFLFSLNCSNDKMKFLFHFSCLYKPKC